MDTFEESASRILESMAEAGRRQQRPSQFAIGKVLEVSETVLRVLTNNQELKTDDLWVNEALLPLGKHALAKDDRVVLLTEDWQFYYLICKVVRP